MITDIVNIAQETFTVFFIDYCVVFKKEPVNLITRICIFKNGTNKLKKST